MREVFPRAMARKNIVLYSKFIVNTRFYILDIYSQKFSDIFCAYLLYKSIANLAMCRFQRHGRDIKSAWAGTSHMRENVMRQGA